MKTQCLLLLFLCLLMNIIGQAEAANTTSRPGVNPRVSELIENFKRLIFDLVDDESDHAYSKVVEKQKTQPIIPENVSFPCDLSHARSADRPTKVNEVRPGDIDVVAAIGDSLTTANGAQATNLLQAAKGHRGLSWSIGGKATWKKHLTLPNILKVFNPNLIGFSESSDDPQFNGAELGTETRNALFLGKALVSRIRSDPRVVMENDWKLLTIMLGVNDFCDTLCFLDEHSFRNSFERLRNYMTLTLDYLRDNLPRTIVNIVPPPALNSIFKQKKGKAFCSSMRTILCPCVFGELRQFPDEEILAMQRMWQQVQHEVAVDERYRKDDFLVLYQPFSLNLTIPLKTVDDESELDMSYLSEDCFHFSQKAHAAAANALWNNMLEPIGQKKNSWAPPFERIICPTEEHPYIFSYDNSPTEHITLDEKNIPL